MLFELLPNAAPLIYLQSFHDFEFKFFGLDQEMATEWHHIWSPVLILVNYVLHHLSSLTRWNGSRGQVWPENDRTKTKLKL